MKQNLNVSLEKDVIEYLNKERKIRNRSISNLVETIIIEHMREKGVEIV